MKAYKTRLGITTCVAIAETAGKAKYATYLSAKEAGYKYHFVQVKAHRLKSLDHLTKPLPCGRQLIPNCVMTPEYAMKPCGCSKCVGEKK